MAFWVSTGARASELLSASAGDADPGQQLITVIRKGTRQLQQLPASPDAFVWLRLYQAQMHGLVPLAGTTRCGGRCGARSARLAIRLPAGCSRRASASLGANWSLHDLRHLAAYRMARDPAMPLGDVQWVLGHAQLTTTQIYLDAPLPRSSKARCSPATMSARRARCLPLIPRCWPIRRHRSPQTLDVLFGKGAW